MLVTGAAGFIGGHLFRRLADYGLDVVATVLHPREAQELRARGFQADVLDLADRTPWDQKLKGVDIVFNIAAMFQDYGRSEQDYDEVNHRGAVKLARCAAQAGVERFIHCSTVGVYGNVKEIPATEQTPFNPMDAYHRTKLAGELAILEFGHGLPAGGMTVTVNRPAMVYGPPDLRMMKLFKLVANGRFRMIGDGQCLAHLGYIEDQTDSFLLCAVAPRENVHLEAFNIASDEPITLNALVRLIADCAGVPLSRWRIPVAPVWLAAWACELVCRPFGLNPPLFRRRVGFFTHNRAFDLSKAQRLLGYRSHWSHRDGVAATLKWYQAQGLL